MKKLFLLLICLILSGCFSTPNSNFYILNAIFNKPISSKEIVIVIYDILVPEYLDRPQIVLQKQQNPEVKISEFNRWASDLSYMLKNVLIKDMQHLLPNAKILPLAFGINSQYVVKIEVSTFSGWLNGKAILSASWQILNFKGRIIYSKFSTYQTDVLSTYASYVTAQSKLWSNLAVEISNKFENL